MPQMIGFEIYRTENLAIDGIPYTVKFSIDKDRQEYILFVSNDQNGNNRKYHFSKETADAFQHYHEEELEDEVKKIIGQDIKNKII